MARSPRTLSARRQDGGVMRALGLTNHQSMLILTELFEHYGRAGLLCRCVAAAGEHEVDILCRSICLYMQKNSTH